MKFSMDGIKKFLKSNWKYLSGSLAFIVLVIVLVNLSEKQQQQDKESVAKSAAVVQEASADAESVEPATSLSVEDYPEVNQLIEKYFASMANNDVDALKQILAEMLEEDEASVKATSEQTESYNNIICYTKPGNVENSYVVFASYEVKFVGVNTTAPGLLSFYVITREDGSLCIQNKLDDQVKDYIQNIIVEDKEVADLFEASQKRYEQALADDTTLSAFVESLESENSENNENIESSETVAETTNEQETETTEETEQVAETTEEEQTAETTEEQTTETATEETTTENAVTYVKAKENVNVRNDASETADAIGKLLGGEAAEKTGEKEGWICINYKGQQGYVKADFVEITSDGTGSVSKATNESSTTSESKEKVYVKETVNIRAGMSQESEKVGMAYAGEGFTKIMDYSDGWTKIDYNGTEAYIKTEFLETR